jgi:hypothetical protein
VLVVSLALFLTISAPPAVSPCTRVTVHATLDPRTHGVHGTAACTVARDTVLRVATYPRLLRTPYAITDVRQPWFYPQAFDPADMTLAETASGKELVGDGAWQELGARHAGEVVTLRFDTKVPRRNGVFGERDGTFYMLGGWHPAFADAGAPVAATTVEFHVTAPAYSVGFAGEVPFGAHSPRQVDGVMEARFVPWLVSGAAEVQRSDSAVIVRPTRAPRGDTPYDLKDISSGLDPIALDELSETVTSGAEWAGAQGLQPKRLTVVLAPLRERLVERFDGGIAVSDRAFHVASIMQRLHRLAIWRAQLATYAVVKARSAEAGTDALPPELVADTIAVILRDALARSVYHVHESAAQMFEHIDIIPEIDSLVFAPQVAFTDAYYEAIDETPVARIHLDDFDSVLPRGKLVATKLADRVGEAGALAMAQAYIPSTSTWLSVVRAGGGEEVVAGLREWLGPTPKLDYVLAEVKTTPEGTRVRVDAVGPDADKVHEPITVRLRYAGKKRLEAMRIGPGELFFPGDAKKPNLVEVDPLERTVQLATHPGETTRYNDRSTPRWRFLLNDITGLFQITNQQIAANADFALRRIHDLRYAFGFSASYAPESVGVSASAAYKFGRPVTPLLLAERIALAIGYNRLRGQFDNATPGDLLSLSVGYGHDDRLNPYFSFEGSGWSTSAGVGYGRDERGKEYVFGQVGASVLHIWQLALGHALVGRLRGDLLIGDAPKQSLLRLGGRYRGGRGYEINEERGTERLIASAEYRHLFMSDMRSDWLRLFTLTRVEGAFFGDVIALPVKRDGCNQDVFTDVGYSVRFIGDVFNLYTSALGLDFGFPLNRCADQREGHVPFTVYAAFLQSFSSF